MPTTERALDLKLDTTHATDGFSGNEHALRIVPLYKDVIELFARRQISYTPTLLVAYGGPWFQSREQIYPQLAAQAGKILKAGGLVVMGGHGQFQGLQCHWEMWALASGGIALHDVLKIAIINGAKSIGFDQDLGSLEPGKLADLLVLDTSPSTILKTPTPSAMS